MSSIQHNEPPSAEATTSPQNIPHKLQDDVSSSTPVEMNSLKTNNVDADRLAREDTHKSRDSAQMPPGPSRVDTTTALHQAQNPPTTPPPMPGAPAQRNMSTAIGPSSDSPSPLPKDLDAATPTLMITLLLTNGARHPFKLDSRYIAKRNVTVQDNDPFNLSVYKLKELILREWRDEWEAKPSSPSAIRLISFGKLLDDKASLKDLKLNQDTANVIHMTIKPQDFIEDEDAKGGKASGGHGRDGSNGRSPGCRCIVM